MLLKVDRLITFLHDKFVSIEVTATLPVLLAGCSWSPNPSATTHNPTVATAPDPWRSDERCSSHWPVSRLK